MVDTNFSCGTNDYPAKVHEKDSDCELIDDDGYCIECQAYHSSPCPICDGRAFHVLGCLGVLDSTL